MNPAPTTFTEPIRAAQHARLVIEMADFFTGLAAEEFEYPAVPDDMIVKALAEALVKYADRDGAAGTVALQDLIERLQDHLKHNLMD